MMTYEIELCSAVFSVKKINRRISSNHYRSYEAIVTYNEVWSPLCHEQSEYKLRCVSWSRVVRLYAPISRTIADYCSNLTAMSENPEMFRT